VKDFIAYAKANPDKITYARVASAPRCICAANCFKRMTGIDMRHVPYRGAGPAMQDVVAGRIDVIFDNLTGGLPQVQGGSARGLAVTTAKRSAAAPDIPTLAESGVPSFDVSAWFAFYLPGQDACGHRAEGQRRHRRGAQASAGAAAAGGARWRYRRRAAGKTERAS
jgi:tripartite-type tricarboxylate transporter receptor subunit TctC